MIYFYNPQTMGQKGFKITYVWAKQQAWKKYQSEDEAGIFTSNKYHKVISVFPNTYVSINHIEDEAGITNARKSFQFGRT